MTSERPQHGDMMARMKLEGSLCTKYVHCTGLKTTAAQKMKKKSTVSCYICGHSERLLAQNSLFVFKREENNSDVCPLVAKLSRDLVLLNTPDQQSPNCIIILKKESYSHEIITLSKCLLVT